jgi:beta-1,4-N-acetylglucosaminyltransferase
MEVEVYCFKPSLAIDMQEADLVISHAGAGCIMESLRFVYPHLLLCDED